MPTTRILAPKVNDPDRRLIDAIGEDKSHSTKETLDDIKRIHQKEKNKKNNVELYSPGIISQSAVRYHLLAYKSDILIKQISRISNIFLIFQIYFRLVAMQQPGQLHMLGIQK